MCIHACTYTAKYVSLIQTLLGHIKVSLIKRGCPYFRVVFIAFETDQSVLFIERCPYIFEDSPYREVPLYI